MGKIAERFRIKTIKPLQCTVSVPYVNTISGAAMESKWMAELDRFKERELESKGKQNGKCNVTACNSGLPATWYNKIMDAYYCPDCAKLINWSPLEDGTYLCSPPVEEYHNEQPVRNN